ncbi:MAG: hypothetical protein ACQSGP_22385, partial [Frankia sp.]
MNFPQWTARMQAQGCRICPSSTGVPVDLRGLFPDGRGFHLLCRGVCVRLAVYRPGRARWQVPVVAGADRPEEAFADWEHRPVDAVAEPSPGTMLVFDGLSPDAQAVWDGARERGWNSYEAGLLRTPEAAAHFVTLLRTLEPQEYRVPVQPGPPTRATRVGMSADGPSRGC